MAANTSASCVLFQLSSHTLLAVIVLYIITLVSSPESPLALLIGSPMMRVHFVIVVTSIASTNYGVITPC